MKRYARVQDGLVAELFETDLDISMLFSPDLVWIEIPDATPVVEGWRFDARAFAAPPPAGTAAATVPTIADLQAEIQRLAAQLAALGSRG